MGASASDDKVRKLPAGAGGIAAKRRGDTIYVCRRGETLWGIASKLSLSLDELLRANGGSTSIKESDAFYIPIQARIRSRCGCCADLLGGSGAAKKTSTFFDGFRVLGNTEDFRKRNVNMRKLFHAMRCVETSNCPLPAPAGDNGTSIGPLQISHAYHNDAWGLPKGQEGSEVQWLQECQKVEYSELTAVKYWMRWCPWALQFGDTEALARAHNGGPKYHKAFKTARYWRKIEKEMDRVDVALSADKRSSARASAYDHFVSWERRKVFEVRDVAAWIARSPAPR